MHRLARFVGIHTVLATRRALPAAPRLCRYVSQKPTAESLYQDYLRSLPKLRDPDAPEALEAHSETASEGGERERESGGGENIGVENSAEADAKLHELVSFEEFQAILKESPVDFENYEPSKETEETDLELELKYEEYLLDREESIKSGQLDPESDPTLSFEGFQEVLKAFEAEDSELEEVEAEDSELEEAEAEHRELGTEDREARPLSLLDEKYDNILAALEELEASPNPFEMLEGMSSQSLELAEQKIFDLAYPLVTDPVFDQRLENLGAETRPEQEVGWRVAQLVLSAKDDKEKLEQVENALARYNGPLSRLNLHVEWYLNHPDEVEAEAQLVADKAAQLEKTDASDPTPFEELFEEPTHDNNSYYYQTTPVDELAQHLRDRDVQYAIKNRMTRADREEFFRLMDRIVAPVLNEDMALFNAIADIFAKYEDVHLVFQTEPRLPRIRRLDVFKRLIPDPEDETPDKLEQEKQEIESIVSEKAEKNAEVQAEKEANREAWPNLMTRDPLMDSRDVLELPPTKDNPFHNRVIVRNHHSIFTEALEADGFDFANHEFTKSDDVEQGSEEMFNVPLATDEEMSHLKMFPILRRFARLQTSKGNKDRTVVILCVGDGKGMVGIGWGKHAMYEIAHKKALADALRNMDWVERFEDRTIWTEVRTKFGATQVIMRPRPVGFGLRCNPIIHKLLNAAGIKDISAKVWGSRNPVGVMKATMRLLHAGHAPLGMGDGIGGPGRKMHKGTGLRNKNQIERARGRRLIDLRI
ncbi:hypothetical protein B0H17DRAFT_986185 [Mycena rosella]|uniref:S5 DRBM domain-containing protein n=1 Tax=Mycena rosella TaxID=1033263 RepID=A0AAD7D775_MYCRO|nr:hypothetical protein B0H17DRAFT_986185 [Mycena rosella]